MKIGLLGCKGTTLDLLHTIQDRGRFGVDQLITLPAEVAFRNRVAFYRGDALRVAGQEMGIPVHVVRSYNLQDPADQAFFREAGLDLLLVIGWERIIPDTVLRLLGKFACGMHGSAYGLPRGRGRSPLNWSILTGQNHFITYLFRYDPGIDSGHTIGFKVFEINEFDDIASLHMKNRTAMYQLLETYIPLIQQDQVTFIPQPPEQPSFYPKRTPQDSGVDRRMSTQAIHRLIRAVAPPYPLAYCFLGRHKLYLLEAAPYDVSLFYGDVEPGTVVDSRPSWAFS